MVLLRAMRNSRGIYNLWDVSLLLAVALYYLGSQRRCDTTSEREDKERYANDLVRAVDAALERYPALKWDKLTYEQQAAAIETELRRIQAERDNQS